MKLFHEMINSKLLLQRVRDIVREERPIRFLLSRLLWITGLCRLLRIEKQDFQLWFYPSSVSALYWTYPYARSADEAFIRRYLCPGNTCVDAGANIGVLTICAALSVGPSGRVYAVEPHPRIYKYLCGNVALNGLTNVLTFQCALGSSMGIAHLQDRRADDMNAISGGNGIQVPMQRLDDLPIENDSVELLKLDVEGYEKYVLEGGQELLRQTQTIYFEAHSGNLARFGYTLLDLISLLNLLGFQCVRILNEKHIILVRPESASGSFENLVATRDLDQLSGRTGLIFGPPSVH